MSISALIKQMRELGAPIEAIEVAVAAIEAEQSKDAERRAKRAAQKAAERARKRGNSGDDDGGGDGGGYGRATVARQSLDAGATPPPPPRTPTPTRTPAQRSAHTHVREGWGQQEVPETWEPRPEVSEFVVQFWVLKGLDGPSAREKARSELQRFRDFSRARGLTFADLDAGFKEWATKHNAPHNRTPLTVVNGVRHGEPSTKPRTVHDAARDLELRLANIAR
ncbi:MAG: hypothetical protein ACJ8FU_08445 [Xanthobacteraceae bacterium]